jgi:undecaprenyl-diphosphatase
MGIFSNDVFGRSRAAVAATVRDIAYPPALLLAAVAAALTGVVLAFGRLPGDVLATKGFQSLDAAWLNQLMVFGDTAGSKPWLFTLFGIALLTLLSFRRWREVSILGLAAAFYAFSPLLKELIQRPRPDAGSVEVLVTPVGYSFPSGHAMGSGLIIGGIVLVAVLTLRGRLRLQLFSALAGLSVLAIVGASRVYLGAHWTSDVIAGYTLAAMFLVVAFRVVNSRFSRLPGAAPVKVADDQSSPMAPGLAAKPAASWRG